MHLYVIIALNLSVLLTFMFPRTFISPPLFMSENSRLCFLFKGPTIPPSTNILCGHALYHCRCHIQSDYLWLVFLCLLPIHHVCTRHALTWCTRFFSLQRYRLSLEGSLLPFRLSSTMPFYISIVGFLKPTWLISSFFMYTLYPSTHRN